MKKFIYITSMILLAFAATACEDELISSANDINQELFEVEEIDNTNKEDSIVTDSVSGDDDIKYPIGFSVDVESFQDW